MTTAIDTELALEERVASLDWPTIRETMDDRGYATVPPILTQDECHGLLILYDDDHRFRSRIDMARYRFGEGEYKYFARPCRAPFRHYKSPPESPSASARG